MLLFVWKSSVPPFNTEWGDNEKRKAVLRRLCALPPEEEITVEHFRDGTLRNFILQAKSLGVGAIELPPDSDEPMTTLKLMLEFRTATPWHDAFTGPIIQADSVRQHQYYELTVIPAQLGPRTLIS
jgi:hypothetical protein